jgi:thymidylate synthase (FAD)
VLGLPRRELLLDRFPVKVLDHGFVLLVDYAGDDDSIDRSARQSYGKGTTRKTGTARGLIRRLMRDRHDSPFESVDITIQLHVPIFVARQILRHRLFSVNELSARYSEMADEFYIPELAQICYQSKKNKQGRAEPLAEELGIEIRKLMKQTTANAYIAYKTMIDADVARETSRMVLPVNIYTTFTLKGNLRTWLHFLSLRMDEHAQWETRMFANEISKIIYEIAPEAHNAWMEYVFGGMSLSRTIKRLFLKHVDKVALTEDEMFVNLDKSEREHLLDIMALEDDIAA